MGGLSLNLQRPDVKLYGRYGFEVVRRVALSGGAVTHVSLLRKALA